MNVKTLLNRGLLFIKKYSPEILTGIGVIAGGVATFSACKATLSLEPIVNKHKEDIEICKEDTTLKMVPKAYRKHVASIYANTAKDLAVIYWPSVVLGTVAVVSVLSANNILRKRNVALMAAYTVLDSQFKDYRKKIIEKYGEETDYNILKEVSKQETIINEATGEVEIKNKTSIYSAFFDEFNDNWSTSADDNLMFLKCAENTANQILKSRGHIFLNEIYEMIGVKHTKYGAVCGWVIGNGDDYVDFGIFDKESDAARLFVNGYERSILLNFNVDGVIYNLI